MMYILVCIFSIVFSLIYLLPMPLIWVLERITNAIFRLDCDEPKTIAITIDDVPYRTNTKSHTDLKRLMQILDLAQKYNVRLNLFIMGSEYNVSGLEKNQLNRAVKDGHLLANHGSYDCCHAKLSEYRLVRQLSECQELIDNCYNNCNIPSPPKFYRPGCGIITPLVSQIANDMDMKIVLGNNYPHDPGIPFSWFNYLFVKWKLASNDIIILHDRQWSIKTMEYLFDYLNQNNYSCVTLDEIYNNATFEKSSGKTDNDDEEIDIKIDDDNLTESYYDAIDYSKFKPRWNRRRRRRKKHKSSLKQKFINNLIKLLRLNLLYDWIYEMTEPLWRWIGYIILFVQLMIWECIKDWKVEDFIDGDVDIFGFGDQPLSI